MWKKRTSIISTIKSKYWQRTHKYGICIPNSIQEAYNIDNDEGNNLWHEAVAEEMVNIKVHLKNMMAKLKTSKDTRKLQHISFLTSNLERTFDIRPDA